MADACPRFGRITALAWAGVALLAGACTGGGDDGPVSRGGGQYPIAVRGEWVDVYHGTEVTDPYRWFETLDSAATDAWIRAENALSRSYLDALPGRRYYARRLAQLIDYERFGVPEHGGGRYVYVYNDGTQEQDSLWITADPGERGKLLIDPGQLAADGTVSIGDFVLSPDGALLAWGASDGGSDWRSWKVLDTDNGAPLPDELHGIKFSDVSWAPAGAGFFYSRYPRTQGGEAYDDQQQVAVWYHAIGTPQSADVEVYRVPDHPTRNPYATVSDDGAYLLIELFDGYLASGLYYKEMHGGKPSDRTVRLLDDWDARYQFLGNDGRVFFFHTNLDAPRGRIIAIDLDRPDAAHRRTVVPESEYAIRSAALVGGVLIVHYMIDAHSAVRTFDLDGSRRADIALPGKGAVRGFEGRADDEETFFSYTDFTTPRSIYRLDIASGAAEAVRVPAVDIDPAVYRTRQVFYSSRDGTRVPMYIVHRRGIDIDGRRPTLLYGYGGFNSPVLPGYSTTRMAWIESGGVYASANLRGGGEYGEAWHRAGTRLNKQNVFDDFIAAAEWLIDNGYTGPDHLAIWGRSNGGLLVAATAVQRPDLFAAVVPGVGVLDMLRYHTASANARQWSTDYGISEDPDEFAALYAYSPYHNLREGICYPPTLVMADANDDRVLPWHSYKFAAALQHAQGCDNEALIRIETRSGHGAGASTSKLIGQFADQWAFVAAHTGLAVPAARPGD
ncbi:MAG: prolyl oligopeptidase family protein [Gammaproteobacteria bacterium]